MLNEMWSGERPHQEYSQQLQLIYQVAVLRRTPKIERSTPAVLAELIRECWGIDPVRRPGAEEVRRRLEEELARVVAAEEKGGEE